MGWYISNIDNTVKVPKKAIADFDKWAVETGVIYDEETIINDGEFFFNSDHLEHMDYVWQDGFAELAKKHKLTGLITFGSLDGDNFGEFWGYKFTKGDMQKLSGKVVWTETPHEEEEDED